MPLPDEGDEGTGRLVQQGAEQGTPDQQLVPKARVSRSAGSEASCCAVARSPRAEPA
ncbi:hypothetical protein [Streptomyces sp. I6]|uniref:hypothetical protein n=1 Tax=Streptomyces sp. I6 TaxID=2483113 RepID=UPI0028803A2D|nr:hypothetical protein [Streptomyces sp. I6]